MKNLSIVLCAILLFVGIVNLSAQQAPTQTVKINGVSSLGEYYHKYQSRVPAQFDKSMIPLQAQEKSKGTNALAMPEKFWHPGEFEEMQAILITWPYSHRNGSYPVDPITATHGFYYNSNTGTLTTME